jgi:hypothetical protein
MYAKELQQITQIFRDASEYSKKANAKKSDIIKSKDAKKQMQRNDYKLEIK